MCTSANLFLLMSASGIAGGYLRDGRFWPAPLPEYAAVVYFRRLRRTDIDSFPRQSNFVRNRHPARRDLLDAQELCRAIRPACYFQLGGMGLGDGEITDRSRTLACSSFRDLGRR